MPGGVSMREILRLPPLAHARVVAGASGLDRRVLRVNVMEVPDILRWVEPNELLLTTAYPLRDDRAALVELVPGLAARGLAGLALKPARYIDAIPAEMLAEADRLAFPLLELPPDASFNNIINAVLTVILNAQASRLQRTAEIHERFTAIVLGGGGLREIAEALAHSISRPVAIVDASGVLQTSAGGADRLGRVGTNLRLPLIGAGAGDADGRPHISVVQIAGGPAVVWPIQVGREKFGAILALDRDGELQEDETDAIEYAATVAALRQVQARAVSEADRRFQAVCLDELVTGHVDRSALAERAAAFKWDLTVPRAVILLQLDARAGTPFAPLAGRPEESALRHRLADAMRALLGRSAIVWERSAEVAALAVVPPGRPALGDIARRVSAEATRVAPDATTSVGAGTIATDPLELARSFSEARRALQVGRSALGAGCVSVFGELGAEQLLVGLPASTLQEFVAVHLEPLLAFDARHRTDLVRTLETWLATRNAALAARLLFVHYNTLKNRLATLEEILGPFLADPERCLALSLALRIHRLPPG